MKTIKLPYKTNENLGSIIKQYSSVVRYSYNRFREGRTEKDIYELIKSLNNINLLSARIVQYAVFDAKTVCKRFKDKKIIFGGKNNFIQLLNDKISKLEFALKRLTPVNIQGEVCRQGNRSFKLDVINNNQIIFKLNRKQHIKLELPKLKNNIKKDLFKLQQLNEIKNYQKGYTYSIRFDLNNVYISFEEFREETSVNLDKNRYLGIDLNPDNIGISIVENNTVIHAQEFSLKLIFDKIFNEKLSSNSNKMKYYQNKLKFETFEISKSISLLAKHFQCKTVFIEDLKFKQKLTKEQKYNNTGNRKCRNLWKRELFTTNLKKRLNILGINLYSVNPAYSSFIGNLQHDYTDSVNSSIEIGRRGFEYYIKNSTIGFYPLFDVKHQWKEMATSIGNWKELYLKVKNLKLKYRVSLNEIKYKFNVFKLSSIKSMVLNYIFCT